MSEADASRSYDVARASLLGGVAVMLVLIMGSLVIVGRFIHRRITGPALELAEVAEAVAAGDLSKRVNADRVGRRDWPPRARRCRDDRRAPSSRRRAQRIGAGNGEHDRRDQRELRGDGGVGRSDRAHGIGSQPAVQPDGRDDPDAGRFVGAARGRRGRPRRGRARRRRAKRAPPRARARQPRAARRQLAFARGAEHATSKRAPRRSISSRRRRKKFGPS